MRTRSLGGQNGIMRLLSSVISTTDCVQRTAVTQWRLCFANGCTEIHHSLHIGGTLIVRGQTRRHSVKPAILQGCDAIMSKQARHHTAHIAIHHHRPPIVSDRHYRRRRVATNPRQCQPFFFATRKSSVALMDNDARRLVQTMRPAVISQALPQQQHVVA